MLGVLVLMAGGSVDGYTAARAWQKDHRASHTVRAAAHPSGSATPSPSPGAAGSSPSAGTNGPAGVAAAGALAALTDPPSAPLTPTTAAEPSATAVAAALAGPLADPDLGAGVQAEVVDDLTGDVLFGQGSQRSAPPASTAKLATAAALLLVHQATDRITTTVLAGTSAGQVVLVGSGDPTLSAAAAGTPTDYADAARITDLAAQLRASGRTVTQIVVADGLFAGPSVSPAWQAADVPSDYASAITALMADGGRPTPDATVRSATPDLAAGAALATDLGLPATAVITGSAPAGAVVLARVNSAPLGELIQQMLLQSDNVIAECLARQVALATGAPASFTGAAAAIHAVLAAHGVEIGAGMLDGSGLAASDRLTPSSLVAVLRLVTGTGALHVIAADLPVAGWDGTLQDRFANPPAQLAAGDVRAKTGTLTGVSTLAGFATTQDGRLLDFSLVADGVGVPGWSTAAAEAALDQVAAALAQLP